MQLVLFRHGIAIDRRDPDCPPDPERALTAKGARRTRASALGLARLGVEPGVVYTSPYVRTVETAQIAADVLGVPHVEQIDALRPGGDPRRVLETARAAGAECVMLVGHAPDLDLVLALALGEHDRPITLLGKAGGASLHLSSGPGGFTELEWLLTPRGLRRLGRG